MSQEERYDPFLGGGQDEAPDNGQAREADDHLLPTISLVHVPHAKILNLYQCCSEYVEPWQWSPEAELVETGRWFFGPPKDDL